MEWLAFAKLPVTSQKNTIGAHENYRDIWFSHQNVLRRNCLAGDVCEVCAKPPVASTSTATSGPDSSTFIPERVRTKCQSHEMEAKNSTSVKYYKTINMRALNTSRWVRAHEQHWGSWCEINRHQCDAPKCRQPYSATNARQVTFELLSYLILI